jgi:hypothetical protein
VLVRIIHLAPRGRTENIEIRFIGSAERRNGIRRTYRAFLRAGWSPDRARLDIVRMYL